MAFRPLCEVQSADLTSASENIVKTNDKDDEPMGNQLGSAFNYWQKPVREFGSDNPSWVAEIKRSAYVGEMDFERKEWARARDTVDAVMNLLLKETRVKASDYEHLRIDSYVRQGSSRDGLKIITPDEFDTVLEFHIEGLKFTDVGIFVTDKYIPGFCYLRVEEASLVLQNRYPALFRKGVFVQYENKMFLSSRALHQSVFESLIDQSCTSIATKITRSRQEGNNVNFNITRSMNPPAINITISYNDDANNMFMVQGQIRNRQEGNREINLDIVPALRLRIDETTVYNGARVNAAVHAVCKWKEENASTRLEMTDQSRIWHVNSAGYERFILDVARTNPKQQFILTAIRILKTCFKKLQSSPSMKEKINIIKSYHLKQIGVYLIFYSCHVYPSTSICNAQQALGFLFALLTTALQGNHLPHFFYSNTEVGKMLCNYPAFMHAHRFDLFRKISQQSLQQAETFLRETVIPNLGFTGSASEDMKRMTENFRGEISKGNYF